MAYIVEMLASLNAAILFVLIGGLLERAVVALTSNVRPGFNRDRMKLLPRSL